MKCEECRCKKCKESKQGSRCPNGCKVCQGNDCFNDKCKKDYSKSYPTNSAYVKDKSKITIEKEIEQEEVHVI